MSNWVTLSRLPIVHCNWLSQDLGLRTRDIWSPVLCLLSPVLCLSSLIPNLPTVEHVLKNGIEGQKDRSQRMQVVVGHPDAHGGVFLPHEVPASDGVAVLVPNPLAQTELDDAEQQGRNAQPKDAAPVAFAVEEDEMYGLT